MNGKPITWFVEQQVADGNWREALIPSEVVGLSKPIHIFLASRKSNLITYEWHGDKMTFCPPQWWDLAIGSGPCGLGCRACFLMLTHRIRRDPLRHVLYDNLNDFVIRVEKWLKQPKRKNFHTLGVGIDRSDSLLYEGVVPYVRSLAPLFGDANCNPQATKLILLTKSCNTHYLSDIPQKFRNNIIVSFSLNPEEIADLWEGVYSDSHERITPSIDSRLQAALLAQTMGFEIRARLDPILTPQYWQQYYLDFFYKTKQLGLNFRYWTLGTYRQKNTQLDLWRERWGLPPMKTSFDRDNLTREGTHWHLPEADRIEIYQYIKAEIFSQFPKAMISLCKETHSVRKSVRLCNAECNCLI